MKALRLRGISTIKETNAYAPEFMADFNARFGKEPVRLGDPAGAFGEAPGR